MEGTPLTVRKGWDTKVEMFVLDSNGEQIHEGDYIQVISDKHNWLECGQIVVATSASATDTDDPSVQYRSFEGSMSGIRASMVARCDTTPALRKQHELVELHYILGHTEQQIGNLLSKRAGINEKIKRVENRKIAE